MNKVFGLPWKNSSGSSGKIQFEIIYKYLTLAGSTAYAIKVREVYGAFEQGVLIQEYRGFYNRSKDKFVLYPKKRYNPSFLEYPFVRHDVSPFWVRDLTARHMETVDAMISLDDLF